VIGNLKEWNAQPLLPKIDVPTLVLNAEFDEARDSCVYPYFEGIKKCRWYTFPGLSHMSNVEDLEAYVKIVEGFLSGKVDE
jgi:pimeloyl-ACP methyl ester carboxylesterase